MLRSARTGQGGAEQLLPLILGELQRIADRQLAGRRDDTLQPTALVHELYLKLVDQDAARIEDRNHFLALCTRVMRQVVIDHARRRNAQKRGGGAKALDLDVAAAADLQGDSGGREPLDILALDEALVQLAQRDHRKARVVEMRVFLGLSAEETAQALGVSKRTAEADWTFARAWLRSRMTPP